MVLVNGERGGSDRSEREPDPRDVRIEYLEHENAKLIEEEQKEVHMEAGQRTRTINTRGVANGRTTRRRRATASAVALSSTRFRRSKKGCPAFVGKSAVVTHSGDPDRAVGLLPIAMGLQCTSSAAPEPSRIRDFCHGLSGRVLTVYFCTNRVGTLGWLLAAWRWCSASWSELVAGAALCTAVSVSAQAPVGALAIDERQGD